MLEAITGTGRTLSDIVVDRAYSIRTAASFHFPVRRLGAQLVFDHRRTDVGVRTTHQGALVIAGWLYSPALPNELRNLERPAPGPRRRRRDAFKTDAEYDRHVTACNTASQKRTNFYDAVTQRERYAFKLHTKADTDGYLRAMCLAQAGKIRCPLVAPSMLLSPIKTQAFAAPTEAVEPVCRRCTITVPPDVLGYGYQKHRWGTRQWGTSYARRNRVENFFGILKASHGAGATRENFRIYGLAKMTLWFGFFCATTNLLKVAAWRRDTADPSKIDARRKRTRRGKYRKATLARLGAQPGAPPVT